MNGDVVYIARATTGECKIGKSGCPKSRMYALVSPRGGKAKLIHTIKSDCVHWLEKHPHLIHEGEHLQGEWFDLEPKSVAKLLSTDWVGMPPNPLSEDHPHYTPYFRENIIRARKVLHMNRDVAAKRADIPLARYSMIEKGVYHATLSEAWQIACALGVLIDDLLKPC